MARGHQYVESQIEFKAVKQVGIRDVTLNDITLLSQVLCSIRRIYLQSISQLIKVIYEENAFSLARLAWLYNHDWVDTILGLILRKVALELLHLVWNDPRLRVETEVDRVLILHLLEAQGQVTLFGYLIH